MTGKKYFWLKLPDDFFTSKRIKKLRSIAGGDTFVIIYLKMQLKALKKDGYLYFDELSPDFAEELALDIDEDIDNVRLTIQYLLNCGLLECSENGKEYCLTYMQNLIGSETSSAKRVREFRQREKQKLLQCNTSVTTCNKNVNGEIEKEIEKEIDIELDNKGKKSKRFIPPTLEEVKNYCLERNNSVNAESFIDFYSSKGWYIGKNKMKDWKAAVRTWEKSRDNKSHFYHNSENITKGNYNFEELEREIKEPKTKQPEPIEPTGEYPEINF